MEGGAANIAVGAILTATQVGPIDPGGGSKKGGKRDAEAEEAEKNAFQKKRAAEREKRLLAQQKAKKDAQRAAEKEAENEKMIASAKKVDDFNIEDLNPETFEWLDGIFEKRRKSVNISEIAQHGVPRDYLTHYLTREHKAASDCRTMPFAIVMFISCAMSAIWHENAPNVAAVEGSIEFYVTHKAQFSYLDGYGFKAFEDVHSHEDFWSWMSQGFVPQVFDFESSYLPTELESDAAAAAEREAERLRQEALTTTEAPLDAGIDWLNADNSLGGYGHDFCPQGKERIRTPKMCELVVPELQGVAGPFNGTVSRADRPRGCFTQSNGLVFYNNRTDVQGNPDSSVRLVCRKVSLYMINKAEDLTCPAPDFRAVASEADCKIASADMKDIIISYQGTVRSVIDITGCYLSKDGVAKYNPQPPGDTTLYPDGSSKICRKMEQCWAVTLPEYANVCNLMKSRDACMQYAPNCAWDTDAPTAPPTPVPTMAPTVQPTPAPTNEARPPGEGIILNFNRLLGGIRIRQERSVEPETTPVNRSTQLEAGSNCPASFLGMAYGQGCLTQVDRNYDLPPDAYEVRWMVNPRQEQWLYARAGMAEAQAKLLELERSGWLDFRTRRIEISIPVWNAEFAMYTLFNVNFFFSRGGTVWKECFAMSAQANWFSSSMLMFMDFFFVACLTWIVSVELRQLYKIARANGCCSIFWLYSTFWNTVDWMLVFNGGLCIIVMFMNLGLIADVHRAYSELLALEADETSGSVIYYATGAWQNKLRGLLKALEWEMYFVDWWRILLSCYLLIMCARFFKAFDAQRRLVVFTKSMVLAWSDLTHLGIVLSCVFFTFMISATAIMGRNVETVTTSANTANQLFRGLLPGQLKWKDFGQAGRYIATIWIFVFQFSVVLQFSNLQRAIYITAYSRARIGSDGAPTLLQDIRKTIKDVTGSLKKQLVSYQLVVNTLNEELMVFSKRHMHRFITIPTDKEETNWIVAHNPHTEKIHWECYSKNEITNTLRYVSSEEEACSGTVVIVTNNRKKDILVLKEGQRKAFWVQLDEKGVFEWYLDDTRIKRSEEMYKNAMENTHHDEEDQAPAMIKAEYLEEIVLGMTRTQAVHIIEGAVRDYYLRHKTERNLEALKPEIQHLDHRVKKLLWASRGHQKFKLGDKAKKRSKKAKIRRHHHQETWELNAQRAAEAMGKLTISFMSGILQEDHNEMDDEALDELGLQDEEDRPVSSKAPEFEERTMKDIEAEQEAIKNMRPPAPLMSEEIASIIFEVQSSTHKLTHAKTAMEQIAKKRTEVGSKPEEGLIDVQVEDDVSDDEQAEPIPITVNVRLVRDNAKQPWGLQWKKDQFSLGKRVLESVTQDSPAAQFNAEQLEASQRPLQEGDILQSMNGKTGWEDVGQGMRKELEVDLVMGHFPPPEADNTEGYCGAWKPAEELVQETRDELAKVKVRVYTVEDLHDMMQVTVLKDVRRVMAACHDAGLAAANAEWRKKAAGLTGIIIEIDHTDRTVRVLLPGLGDIWLAAAALRPAGPTTLQLEEQKRLKQQAKLMKSKADQDRYALLTSKIEALEAQKESLTSKLQEEQISVSEGLRQAQEMRAKLDEQLERKLHYQVNATYLEEQRTDAHDETNLASQALKDAYNTLQADKSTRMEYMEATKRLTEENSKLVQQLVDEEQSFHAHKEATHNFVMDIEKQREEFIQHTESLKKVRVEQELMDQRDLTWLVGRAEYVLQALEREGVHNDILDRVQYIRDTAMSICPQNII
eukprot:TRINITY_DN17740_c0_g1_i1.p1 TRINITY_DN17740_c0_g1~~TRINITY_DN17740_c0_g1_i1.p1  ORF type:complete len:1753 (-),score=508.22 TRINITY_DN17740_c0_g1_i1:213-5471(-)